MLKVPLGASVAAVLLPDLRPDGEPFRSLFRSPFRSFWVGFGWGGVWRRCSRLSGFWGLCWLCLSVVLFDWFGFVCMLFVPRFADYGGFQVLVLLKVLFLVSWASLWIGLCCWMWVGRGLVWELPNGPEGTILSLSMCSLSWSKQWQELVGAIPCHQANKWSATKTTKIIALIFGRRCVLSPLSMQKWCFLVSLCMAQCSKPWLKD